MNEKPALKTFVNIPFGDGKQQVGFVEAYTSTGRVKVRAYNASRSKWMPNTRTLDVAQIIGPASTALSPPA